MGPYVSCWAAWATDPEIRFAGSSGGVLTALSQWLVATGRASAVRSAGSRATSPSRTTAVTIGSRADAIAAAGSRYAPASVLASAGDLLGARGGALVGRPCEVDAARRLGSERATDEGPLLLSFFCAGVPSQHATDELVSQLAGNVDDVVRVTYRGRGWPGSFTVSEASGRVAEMSYADSWGAHLGRRLQSRCSLCPDGTGGHADVAVGDLWRVDGGGFPAFDDADGVSVAIARTVRGHELLLAARDAGVVELRAVEPDAAASVQPLQTRRRLSLLPRLVGRRLAGRRVPRLRGYRMWRLAVQQPRSAAWQLIGSYRRTRRLKREPAMPPAAQETERARR